MLIGQSPSDPIALAVFGPTVRVDIGFDHSFDPEGIAQLPVADLTDVLALIDTGATENRVDEELAAHLGLPIVDRAEISGIGGTRRFLVYLAQVVIAFPTRRSVVFGSFYGAAMTESGFSHRVLLGRRFLRDFVFTYNGKTGEVFLDP